LDGNRLIQLQLLSHREAREDTQKKDPRYRPEVTALEKQERADACGEWCARWYFVEHALERMEKRGNGAERRTGRKRIRFTEAEVQGGIMQRIVFGLLVLALPVFAQDQSTALRSAAGCGPAKTQFSVKVDKKQHAVAQSGAGKALVYVIVQEKPDNLTIKIGDITTRVGLDGNWMGANYGESYLSFAVEPGEHHVCTDWQSSIKERQNLSGAADLTAEAGKTYYFQTEVFLATQEHQEQVRLKAVDSAEGILLVSKAGKSTWKEKK
jgi:hypothetical protein